MWKKFLNVVTNISTQECEKLLLKLVSSTFDWDIYNRSNGKNNMEEDEPQKTLLCSDL